MLLIILRAVFILIVAGVAMSYVETEYQWLPPLAVLIISLGAACLVIGIDIFIPRKSLMAISGVFFGLIVGMLITYGVSHVLNLIVLAYNPTLLHPRAQETSGFYPARVDHDPWAVRPRPVPDPQDPLPSEVAIVKATEAQVLMSLTKILIGTMACYLAISFILQTKDDIRFVIPYVEFAKQRKGQHPMILDTSVIIDGRIADILETWRTDVPVVIPRFVIHELQNVADSSDRIKRNRGRRGLDIVNRLQGMKKLDLQFQDVPQGRDEPHETVDQRLLSLAKTIDGRIVTNDYNLNKVAQIRGVEVMNVNDLANALKPVFLPGESVKVKIIKPGEEPGQGVGYLDDGTMVVVEGARDRINETLDVVVTSMLQTSAGRMVFGRPQGAAPPDRPRRRSGQG